jgi:hypothetical protein
LERTTVAYPVSFDKETGEGFLQALMSGQPVIPPGIDAWDINSILALAGACYFAAMSHGPLSLKNLPGIWEKLPLEQREAREETLSADLHLAIEFYGQLTMFVKDEEFDESFDPHVEAIVYEHDGRKSVQPHVGFRKA